MEPLLLHLIIMSLDILVTGSRLKELMDFRFTVELLMAKGLVYGLAKTPARIALQEQRYVVQPPLLCVFFSSSKNRQLSKYFKGYNTKSSLKIQLQVQEFERLTYNQD